MPQLSDIIFNIIFMFSTVNENKYILFKIMSHLTELFQCLSKVHMIWVNTIFKNIINEDFFRMCPLWLHDNREPDRPYKWSQPIFIRFWLELLTLWGSPLPRRIWFPVICAWVPNLWTCAHGDGIKSMFKAFQFRFVSLSFFF